MPRPEPSNLFGCSVAVSAAKKPNLTHLPTNRQHPSANILHKYRNTSVLQRKVSAIFLKHLQKAEKTTNTDKPKPTPTTDKTPNQLQITPINRKQTKKQTKKANKRPVNHYRTLVSMIATGDADIENPYIYM